MEPHAKRLVPESRLPARYQSPWKAGFVAEALAYAKPNSVILDAGGGARPTLAPAERPDNCWYIGLDPDRDDLFAGEYDERIVAGAEDPEPQLVGSVDLILSWNVLEHVPDMPATLDRFHELLRPGGVLLARFSGRWALFAVSSRLMPHGVRTRLLASLLGTSEEDHFPTHYDRCTARDFDVMLSDWADHRVTPHYRAAGYLGFSRRLQRAYLAYEEVIAMRTPQLATHYHVCAIR